MKDSKYLFKLITIAVLIKVFLFFFLVTHAPQARFMNDSRDYIETAEMLSSKGEFARISADGSQYPELFRTPGYPVFLAVLRNFMKLPFDAIIFIQILLTLLAALATYKAAVLIDPKIAFLSSVIILYDPNISIFSLVILSDVLFLFFLSLFMLAFINYLKKYKIYFVVLSALLLAIATYIRPISYYLVIPMGIFIFYANIRSKNIIKSVTHALIFVILIFNLFGLWESRNHKCTGSWLFSSVMHGVPNDYGLFKSFSRNKDLLPKNSEPVTYYVKTTFRCFLSLMSRPGPFKYFKSSVISVVGRIFAYPWVVFWMIGFIVGMIMAGWNISYQFMVMITAYFISACIVGTSLGVSERLRLPMMPFIAIISSYGWLKISGYFKKND